MFINETIFSMSFIATIFLSSQLYGTDLKEWGFTGLLLLVLMHLFDKVIKIITKTKNESEKIDAIYKVLLLDHLEEVKKCSNKDNCPIYKKILSIHEITQKRIEEDDNTKK